MFITICVFFVDIAEIVEDLLSAFVFLYRERHMFLTRALQQNERNINKPCDALQIINMYESSFIKVH